MPIRLPHLCMFACVVAAGAVAADDDHERALEARARGDVQSLASIIEAVRPALGGEIVGIELEREDGIFIYEFQIVTTAGRLEEVTIDAATGKIMEREEDD